MMLLKLVDELVIGLMRIICTTDVDAGVRYARKDGMFSSTMPIRAVSSTISSYSLRNVLMVSSSDWRASSSVGLGGMGPPNSRSRLEVMPEGCISA